MISKLLPAVSLAMVLCAASAAHGAEDDPEAELSRTIRERLDAVSSGNASVWAGYVDDSCLCAGETKADIVGAIAGRPAGVKIRYGDVLDLQARFFADLAVAYYRVAESVEVNGQLTKSEHWRTETYARRSNRWVLVAGAENLIPPEPTAVTVGGEVLARYVGRYEYTPGSVDTVTLEGNQLFVEPTGEPKVAIFAEDPHTFFAKGQEWRLVFRASGDGPPTSLVFRQGGQEFVAKRLIVDDAPKPLARVDHILIGASNLDRATAEFERLTGVRPVYGGKHPVGTHNALVALGDRTYLELIALQPGVTPPPSLSELGNLQHLTPIGWAVSTPEPQVAREQLERDGFEVGGLQPGSRTKPDGSTLRWRTYELQEQLGGAPFFISWDPESTHPSATSPSGCKLETLSIATPDSEPLGRLVSVLGIGVAVAQAQAEQFKVALECPRGKVVFESDPHTP
jgi:hypothetical protein